jgi:ABC-type nitrate/sulfonate/bicarbonate transport system substrate-binding protein
MQAPWVNDAEFIGYFVALDQGYFERQGLSLTYKSGGPDVIAEGAVLARQADLALAPIETTANLIVNENAPLKIIGAQYQRSPLGVVSLAESKINRPSDLIGKTLAAPPANVLTTQAMLRLNNIDPARVKIVPYAYDPQVLIKHQADATIDFVTNVPFSIKQLGAEANSFLLWDFKFKVYTDVVVVTDSTLRTKRQELVSWLKASRMGWTENFKDTKKYPAQFMQSHFKSTGRTNQNEEYFNERQRSLIETPNGIFTMNEKDIGDNLATLAAVDLRLQRDVFVTGLVEESLA